MRGEVSWNEPRLAFATGLALGCTFCGFPFLVTALCVRGQAGLYFGVLGAVVLAIAAVAAPMARFCYAEARSLRLDPVGLRLRRRGRWRTARWDEIDGCRMDLKAGELVFTAGAETIRLRPAGYANPNAIYAALRCWYDGYELTEADRDLLAFNEETRAFVERVRQRVRELRADRPANLPRPESYRGGAKRPEDVASGLPALRRRYWALLLALVAMGAGTAACVVAAVSGASTWPGLAALVAGVILTLVITAFFAEARRRYQLGSQHVELLGHRVLERSRGVWESEDRAHRYRCTAADDNDLWCGPHLHYEELDEDGTTRRTFYVTCIFGSQPPTALLGSWLAAVTPETWRTTCFAGPPWKPGEASGAPRQLLLQETADGFVLTRFDASRRYAGDTWHATRAGVALQIERELGVTVDWRTLDEAPRGYAFLE